MYVNIPEFISIEIYKDILDVVIFRLNFFFIKQYVNKIILCEITIYSSVSLLLLM